MDYYIIPAVETNLINFSITLNNKKCRVKSSWGKRERKK